MNSDIQIGSFSIIGNRKTQQDAMRCEIGENMTLSIVCDGMGGMQGGELASTSAISSIVESFRESRIQDEKKIPYWMHASFQKADAVVSELKGENGEFLGAGTTVVAACAYKNNLYWGSVGDSCIYYIHDGQLQVVNRMHNYHMKIDEMLRSGQLLPEYEAEERKQGEALISYLGMGGLSVIDVCLEPIVMEPGDILILCSDGLYKGLDKEQILAITEESGGNMQLAAYRLCNEAARLSLRKLDNTTVIAIRYPG